MPKITATLSRRVDARGKSEILLRFVGGRDHVYRLHSRLSVTPSRWKDGAVIVPRLETDEQRELRTIRDRLADLVRFILDEFQAADQAQVTGAWIQEAVDRFHHPDRKDRRGFFELFDEFCRSQDVSVDRHKRYKVVRGYLEGFQEDRKKKLTPEGIDAGVLDDFRAYLAKGGRGKNVIIDYMKVVRAFFRWAGKRGLCAADPFRGFQIGTAVYGTPYYLTLEERDRLARTNLRRTRRSPRSVTSSFSSAWSDAAPAISSSSRRGTSWTASWNTYPARPWTTGPWSCASRSTTPPSRSSPGTRISPATGSCPSSASRSTTTRSSAASWRPASSARSPFWIP